MLRILLEHEVTILCT